MKIKRKREGELRDRSTDENITRRTGFKAKEVKSG